MNRNLSYSLAILGAALLVAVPREARAQYCPSYTPAISNCGINPVSGVNPTTAEWQQIFAKVGAGKASWGTAGPDISTMGSGCGKPTPSTQVPAHFPCDVLFAIAYQESGWNQFCKPTSPSSQVGQPVRTIVSFDCGYGVGQVTSGMRKGETPSFDRARVAAEATYNLATGTRILRDKWAATGCVGDNLPEVIEHYYYALWAYNGIAYSNNPNNPNKKAGRAVYNPAKDSGNQTSWTYQERLFGMVEYPSGGRWRSQALAYPNRANISTAAGNTTTKLADTPEPTCASPTDCTTRRGVHRSQCIAAPVTDAGTVVDSGSLRDSAIDATSPDATVDYPGGPFPIETPGSERQSSGCSCEIPLADGGASAGMIVSGLALLLRVFRRRQRVAS